MTSKDDYMDNTIPTNNSYINTYLNTNINTNMETYFLYNMNYNQPYILSNAITPSNVITLSNQLAPILNPDTMNGATNNGDTMNANTDIIPTNEYNDINPPLFNHIYDIVLTNNQYAQIIAFLNSIY